MKVIRAKRGVYVPRNPENPDKNEMRLVQSGLIAIVPDSYILQEGTYQDLGELILKDDNKKTKKSKEG